MKKWMVWVLILLLAPGMIWAGCAEVSEDDEDSEASLRELIGYSAPDSTIDEFYYGDYDGDGINEAFALLNEREWSGILSGDLWFASPLFCNALQTGKSYCMMQKCGNSAPILFTAEENYGGSGSTSYLWTVIDSTPIEVNMGELEGFDLNSYGEFVIYPSAFDRCTNGTGHTWKAYYCMLDGLEIVEYGGMYIKRDELEQYRGAAEILSAAEKSGYRVGDIIYRDNGVINVNLCDGSINDNLTLRISEDRFGVWDTGEQYGGIYDLTSGTTSNVVYADHFPAPGTYAGGTTAAPDTGSVGIAVPKVAGGSGDTSGKAEAFNQFINRAQAATAVPQTTAFVPNAVSATACPVEQTKWFVRATEDVNVRSNPNLNGVVLRVLYAGDKLEYLNESRRDERGVEWFKVSVNGVSGWVSSARTTLEQSSVSSNLGTSTSSNQTIVISGGKCNIRSGPSLNYEILSSLNEGREVRYLGKSSTDSRGVIWYNIEFQGIQGWVSSKYARLR